MLTPQLSPRNQYLLLVLFGCIIFGFAVALSFGLLGIDIMKFFTSPESVPQSNAIPYKGTVNDLLARGGNYSCTFDQRQNSIRSTGTAVLSDKKMAVEAQVMVSGFSVNAQVVGDGKKFYIWTSLPGSKGTVIAYSDLKKIARKNTPQANVLNQKMDFMCSPWVPDETQFEIPADVTFNQERVNL